MPKTLPKRKRAWLTATEAAKLLGITPRHARVIGARYGVAFKLGVVWRFDPARTRALAAGQLEPQPDSG